MPAPFSILALDLHNTIYDEVMEYGLALNEAIAHWKSVAERQGKPLARELLCRELSEAHRELGSDWDAQAWHHMPSLAHIGLNEADFEAEAQKAESLRREKSRQLTLDGFYPGVHDTLAALKKRGVRLFVVSEASADAAKQAMAWLKLEGLVDGVYSYPSRIRESGSGGTFYKTFPDAAEGGYFKKPHPYLLAAVALDEAIRRESIPANTALTDMFTLTVREDEKLPGLSPEHPMQWDVASRLTLRDTEYAAIVKTLLDTMLYVGDSKFKDGLLARNCGVAFGYAAYGKRVTPGNEALHRQSLEIMYATTGWDDAVMKLTQEAARSEIVNGLKPEYVFEKSLAEALGLFMPQSTG